MAEFAFVDSIASRGRRTKLVQLVFQSGWTSGTGFFLSSRECWKG